MTKSVKEWMLLLNESVDTDPPADWTDEDANKLIADPQVGEYYNFVSNTGVELRGVVTAVDGEDYTLNSDGEIYHVTIADMRDKSEAGEITESEITDSVLTEAINTNQLMASLALLLGLSMSAPANAGLLKDLAASIEETAPKAGAMIVTKAKEASKAAGEVYDAQSPKVIAAAKDAATATGDAIKTYGPKVIDGAKSAGMTTATYVAKYYNEKSPEVIDGAKKLGISTAEYIKIQTPEVIAAAKKAGVTTGDYLADQYKDKSPAVAAAGKQAAKATGAALSDVADRSRRAAKEFVK